MIVGALGLGLTWYFSDPDQRSRLLELASPLAVAGVMSALIASPYLYYLLDHDTPPNLVSSPGRASSNVLNFLFANTSSELGRWLPVDQLFRLRPGDLGPGDAYFGVPLLIVVVLYARAHWREAGARILLASLGVILTLMLGPRLRVGSWTGFGMPWKLLAHIPMVRNALPGRYAVYAFLVVGIIAARWIADQKHHPRRRAIVAVLVVAAGLPNLASGFWTRPVDLPAFFAAGSYQRYLRPGEVILPLPFGSIGYTMLWQAATDMYFRMAVGYTGLHPREFDQWPIINAFANTTLIPDATLQLKAFMAAHEVTAIVADDSQLPQWGPLLATIDPAPAHVGGVAVYRFAPSAIAQYGGLSADEMARRDAAARFAALLEAAHRYLAAGQNLAALTPMHAQQMGLIPPGWVDDPDVRTNNGLYLGPWPNGRVAVGLVGSYEALKPLIDQYRSRASAILFPFPRPLADPPQGDTFMRLIVFVFDRATVINPVPQAPSAPAKLRAP